MKKTHSLIGVKLWKNLQSALKSKGSKAIIRVTVVVKSTDTELCGAV